MGAKVESSNDGFAAAKGRDVRLENRLLRSAPSFSSGIGGRTRPRVSTKRENKVRILTFSPSKDVARVTTHVESQDTW